MIQQAIRMRPFIRAEKEKTVPLPWLKSLAAKCAYLNLVALVIFLAIFSFVDISNSGAILCGILAILVALLPVFVAIQKKKLTIPYPL